MKIQRISENQICCILTSQDLRNNQLKMSEFARGTEKAKEFFHSIMVQAKDETGFDMEGSSIMIEAIPQLPDAIKLIITKVNENGEKDSGSFDQSAAEPRLSGADGILKLFSELRKANADRVKANAGKAPDNFSTGNRFKKVSAPASSDEDILEAFRFSTLDNVIAAARALDGIFTGKNSLYKDGPTPDYLLVVNSTFDTPEHFNKICNILSEYGTSSHCTKAAVKYLEEHDYTILPCDALNILSQF